MKRLIVILLILILVAGGGAGGLIMLGIVPNPFASPETPALTAAEQAASAVDHKRFKPPIAAPRLVKVDDMIVPVIIDGAVRRRVFISARLLVRSPDREEPVQLRMGAFQNAVIGDLVPFFQDYYVDHDTIDLNIIKTKLRKHAETVYGEDVSDVLLVNVFDQTTGRSG